MLKYQKFDIVFQEVPNEITIAFSIVGCDLRCVNCHSQELWDKSAGKELSEEVFEYFITSYWNYLTCVCFFGGEWQEEDLISLFNIAHKYNLKICLYTGREDVSDNIKKHLTYLKTGAYIEKLGNLKSKDTNQVFMNVKTNEKLNHLFWEKEV